MAYHDFRDYMSAKRSKLAVQTALPTLPGAAGALFRDAVLWIDPQLGPLPLNMTELTEMALLHGAQIRTRITSDVTHLIADDPLHVLLNKQEVFIRQMPVVRPAWITESIQEERTLPWRSFQWLRAEDPHQRQLAFPAPSKTSSTATATVASTARAAAPTATASMSSMASPAPPHAASMSPTAAISAADTTPVLGKRSRIADMDLPVSRFTHGPPWTPTAVPRTPVVSVTPTLPRASALLGHPDAVATPLNRVATPSPQSPPPLPRPPSLPPPPLLLSSPPPSAFSSRSVSPFPSDDADQTSAVAPPAAGKPAARGSSYLAAQPKQVDPDGAWMKRHASTDPQFLERYFQSSRLHHLTTWKTELRDFAAQLWQARPPRPPRPPGTPTFVAVMHVDMDCFFASIAMRNRPHLREVPVVVAHALGMGSSNAITDARPISPSRMAQSAQGSTSEIASCNYAARGYGIRNGMTVGRAYELCPRIQVAPYDFAAYNDASRKLLSILVAHADQIQVQSCDEAFIRVDTTSLAAACAVAQSLRAQIRASTGCPASIGISHNMLLARLATTVAKPDGMHAVPAEQTAAFMESQPIANLPGVGRVTVARLRDGWNVATCGDLMQRSRAELQSVFGTKAGATLYDAARGRDDRVLEPAKPRKTIGAEVNWGIRFQTGEQVHAFCRQLSGEVMQRLNAAKRRGTQITVKAKRARYEGEPSKVLGHGLCDDFSKSTRVPRPFRDASDLAAHVVALYDRMEIPASKLRGLGIHVGQLLASTPGRDGAHPLHPSVFFKRAPTLEAAAARTDEPISKVSHVDDDDNNNDNHRKDAPPHPHITDVGTAASAVAQSPAQAQLAPSTLPPPSSVTHDMTWSQIDPAVYNSLPAEIQGELREILQPAGAAAAPPPLSPARAATTMTTASVSMTSTTTANRRERSATPPDANAVDLRVLEALPPDIQEEVRAWMRAQDATRQQRAASMAPAPGAGVTPLRHRPLAASRPAHADAPGDADEQEPEQPEQPNEDTAVLTPSDFRPVSRDAIDPSVLKALPEAMVRELERQLPRTETPATPTRALRRRAASPRARSTLHAAEREDAADADADADGAWKTIDDALDPDVLHGMVRTWTDAYPDGPLRGDTQALAAFLASLVAEAQWQAVETLLRAVHRIAATSALSGTDDDDLRLLDPLEVSQAAWKTTLDQLVDAVQTACVAAYGAAWQLPSWLDQTPREIQRKGGNNH